MLRAYVRYRGLTCHASLVRGEHDHQLDPHHEGCREEPHRDPAPPATPSPRGREGPWAKSSLTPSSQVRNLVRPHLVDCAHDQVHGPGEVPGLHFLHVSGPALAWGLTAVSRTPAWSAHRCAHLRVLGRRLHHVHVHARVQGRAVLGWSVGEPTSLNRPLVNENLARCAMQVSGISLVRTPFGYVIHWYSWFGFVTLPVIEVFFDSISVIVSGMGFDPSVLITFILVT